MKARRSLLPDGEHQYGVVLRFICVERDIAGSPLRNHEFAQAYQGMTRKDANGRIDQVRRFQRVRAAFREKVADPFKDGQRLVEITYSCHDLVRGLPVCWLARRWRR